LREIDILALLKNKIEMSGSARAGIGILIMGALLLGIGYYQERGALSLYGLIMTISGFSLYMISSIYTSIKNKRYGSK
jgi:membrane-bound ClpP family serine protease